ncbi:hypothetical protein [Brevibacillus laterosporus]|uniref:hypothetical protein n=1 Tax=Brevibacillus laterosporus TaxID=1465 RepID=UPI0018F8AD56|nr:hypothetical protein [Brevibacillus laterosporus]MBG9774091.1 hypothetical protein [Brevibacillus laterosporus]
MVKKIGIAVLFLLIGIYAINLQIEKKELELRMEILAGHNLFLLLTTYDEIHDLLNSDKKSTDIIINAKKKLENIKEFSSTIDTAIGRGDLQTIYFKFTEIFSRLENINTSVGNNKLKELVEIKGLIQDLKTSILETYYEKNNTEGGKAELYIKDFGKIDAYIEKITKFNKEFTLKN